MERPDGLTLAGNHVRLEPLTIGVGTGRVGRTRRRARVAIRNLLVRSRADRGLDPLL
jgi:hypothetical protein